MDKEKINELINEDYKPLVYLKSNKDYTKMLLKTKLEKENSDIVYPVYYNHVKKLLNNNQLKFIEYYNIAKNLKFNKLVELNIKSKNLTLNKHEMSTLTMHKAIKKMQYLEQK